MTSRMELPVPAIPLQQSSQRLCHRRHRGFSMTAFAVSVVGLVVASSLSFTGWVDATMTGHGVSSVSRRFEIGSRRLLVVRGGETSSSSSSSVTTTSKRSSADDATQTGMIQDDNVDESEDDRTLRSYRMQQHLYLTSRSLQLRQALIGRGLTELAHSSSSSSGGTHTKPLFSTVDWECARSTVTSPKSCLYALDAELGAKVIAPALSNKSNNSNGGSTNQQKEQSYQWITVAALNRLRRNDPTKVEPLWHNQYAILSTWFHTTDHSYRLASHLPLVPGQVLTLVLDRPWILTTALTLVTLGTLLVTWPLLEAVASFLLTSRLLWQYWSSWSRIVHAALPLKLLLVQMAVKALQQIFGTLQARVQANLVEWECRLLQDYLPLTILETEAPAFDAGASNENDKLQNDMSEEYDDDDDDDDNDDEEEEGE